MTIVLVRHAETVFNATRVVQPPDTPLSDRGRAQAARLAERLATSGVRRILSSDLARARATAEALHEATRAPIVLDPDLQERNYGAVRGTPYAALDVDIFGPDYVPPEGESWAAFHARVDRAWEHVVRAAAETAPIAVVTHGLVCYSLLLRHVLPPPGVAPSMRWGNTSVTLIDGPTPWRARVLDCTAHLDEALRADGAKA